MKTSLSSRSRMLFTVMLLGILCSGHSLAYTGKTDPAEELDTIWINNKIKVLDTHTRYWFLGQYTRYRYPFKLITPEEFQNQKPESSLSFDAGFITREGVITISLPVTGEQKAVFKDITQVALYYMCQSYICNFYGTSQLPLIFKVGFGIFEGGLLPPDDVVKAAINNYGGALNSFDELNDVTAFCNNKGYYVAGVFCEFMNVYKNWAYQYINSLTDTDFGTDSWWFNTGSKEELLADFNRYINARFLRTDENSRVKICYESEHFRFYTTPRAAAINLPEFSNVLDSAYTEYSALYRVEAGEKLTFFTMTGCEDGDIEGITCDPNGRLAGGTAWSSGLHTTSSPTAELLVAFRHQNRHELAHAFQGLIHQGIVTAWLNEGFPDFNASGPITDKKMPDVRQNGIDALTRATSYFGHRPTYEETRIYPSPDYGYYTLGYFLNDYIHKRGGYDLVKAFQVNDLAACQQEGYATTQAFLEAFYFYFDVAIQKKEMVTLQAPVIGNALTNPEVSIAWKPLSQTEKYTVSVSVDNQSTWMELAAKTMETSCLWKAGAFHGRFYLKFSTPDNLNLQNIYGPFMLTDLNAVNLQRPAGNEFFITDDTVSIQWLPTNVENLKIEFSNNGGTSWKTIASLVSASSKSYKWIVPEQISEQCKIRLSDALDSTNNSVNLQNFSIIQQDQVGGPYLNDKNTVVLLHFDNDLNNHSGSSDNPTGFNKTLCKDENTIPGYGNCYPTISPLTISHSASLNLSADWTIEAWVKLNSFNPVNDGYIVQKPGDSNSYLCNYALSLNPWWGNVVYGFYFSDSQTRIGVISQTLKPGDWYHVAMIRDSRNKILKVVLHDKNKVLLSSVEQPYIQDNTYLNQQSLIIGSCLDGYLDEVRISNVARDFATGIKNSEHQQSLAVCPNPSKGVVRIHAETGNLQSILIITSPLGKIVYRERIERAGDYVLDLSHLNKGVYLMYTVAEGGPATTVTKLIIE